MNPRAAAAVPCAVQASLLLLAVTAAVAPFMVQPMAAATAAFCLQAARMAGVHFAAIEAVHPVAAPLAAVL